MSTSLFDEIVDQLSALENRLGTSDPAPSGETTGAQHKQDSRAQKARGTSTRLSEEILATLMFLENQPDSMELMKSGQALESGQVPTEALTIRVLLLERFYRCTVELLNSTQRQTAKSSKPEQVAAVFEFAESLGLISSSRDSKQVHLLASFAGFLTDAGYAEELIAAIREHRRADVPIEIRKSAVSNVQTEFGINSWGAARRRLSDAQRSVCTSTGILSTFASLPIPGGDVGED
ncbi:MAG: hypothetical protein JRG96_14940 [Deltaproteobacteria bacterium]|nr:hypothetical protein [Deltaproteobacteria bacterium]